MNKEVNNNWHIKRELSIGHMLTTIAVIVSAIWWAAGMETRQAVTETKVMAVEKTVNKLEQYLIRIESKVDRIK